MRADDRPSPGERPGSLLRLRPATLADERAIVALNAASVAVTSPMDGARFRRLLARCSLALAVERDGEVVAFLMGFNDGSDYESANYRWFASRLKRFFYVDRVVVSETCRGSGIGGALYAHVGSWAAGEDIAWLAAEMDLDPPNPGSLGFHRARGFVPIGTQVLDGGKVVSMQVRALGEPGTAR